MAVKDHQMSIRKAALHFNVPKTTLIDRLHGRISIDTVKPGPDPLFTLDQESLLASHIQTMGETTNLASLRPRDKPLTDRWLYKFLDRWPALKPGQDKGLSLEHKPPKIVSSKHGTTPAVTGSRGKNVTVIGCVKGPSLLDGVTPGTNGTVSPTGWSNTEVFSDYVKEHWPHQPVSTLQLQAMHNNELAEQFLQERGQAVTETEVLNKIQTRKHKQSNKRSKDANKENINPTPSVSGCAKNLRL
ncbi:hypothetical protein DPMN_137286 [Dreissena polymorpha]|uniref:HTH psq-type domain-containing protein n=1 Tax=Dreissena polymorpha TaxID=45954 RepID=A0A9D4JGA7_DREPO|nr:hypothetical protein DPMN_137286 [Dreissena polymorpha]